MSRVVVDASIAVAWCFEDEPDASAIADAVRENGGLVPGLWHLEVANVLIHAERRGRIADVPARLALLAALPIETDGETSRRAWEATTALARSEGLTAYDAAYLELALRRGARLATRDGDLAAAARRMGVALLE